MSYITITTMWERNIKNKTSTYITPTCIVTCTDELFVMQAEMYIIMLIIALSRSQGSSMGNIPGGFIGNHVLCIPQSKV